METVVLIILLLLALTLIGVVLLQRSEGGGLGMGGGGGAGGGLMTGRSAATAMAKLTWILGAAFMAAALALTIIAAQQSSGASVLDRIGDAPAAADDDAGSPALDGESLLPPVPAQSGDGGLVPDAE